MKINFGEITIEKSEPITVYDAAAEAGIISRAVIAATVNGETRALTYAIENDADVKLLTFADAEGATEIEAPEAIAALGHTEETIAGSAATCTATGLTEGKKCSVCDATIVAQEEIALLGSRDPDIGKTDWLVLGA